MPLLILFWDAKKLGVAFLLMAFGNIFNCFTLAAVLAAIYWVAYNKAQELGVRGLLRHRAWWYGFFPGKMVFSLGRWFLTADISQTPLFVKCILDGVKNEIIRWYEISVWEKQQLR